MSCLSRYDLYGNLNFVILLRLEKGFVIYLRRYL